MRRLQYNSIAISDTKIRFGNLQAPNTPCHGYTTELAQLKDWFSNFQDQGSTKAIRVSGIPGIGKAPLVRGFINSLQDCHVAWFSASEDPTLRQNLEQLALDCLNVKESYEGMSFSSVVRHVLNLVAKKNDRKWVMVLDHADKETPHFTKLTDAVFKANIFLIVITRDISSFRSNLRMDYLPLAGLSEADGVEFITELLPTCEAEQAKKLRSKLGGHSLAMDMCISYIKNEKLINVKKGEAYGILDFLAELRSFANSLGQGHVLDGEDGHNLKEIMNLILKSILPKLDPEVFECLVILSQLPSENVSFDFVDVIFNCSKTKDTDRCIRKLKEFGLVSSLEEESSKDCLITTHPLVQLAVNKELDLDSIEMKNRIFEQIIHFINNCGDLKRKNVLQLITVWENIVARMGRGGIHDFLQKQDVPHLIFKKLIDTSALREGYDFAKNVLKAYAKFGIAENKITLKMEGLYYQAMIHLGKYKKAVEGLDPLFKKMSGFNGIYDLDTLYIRNDLARALYFSGSWKRSLTLQLSVYKLRKTILENNHKDTIDSLHNYAIFLSGPKGAKEFKKALAIHKEILNLRTRQAGNGFSMDVFYSKHQIAFCKLQMGMAMPAGCCISSHEKKVLLESAKNELEKLLCKSSSHMESDHKEILRSQYWLAVALNELKDGEKALKIAATVYEMRSKVLGKDHKETRATRDLIRQIVGRNCCSVV